MEQERNHKVKAEISNLTVGQAGKIHREILRVKDEIAPQAHGHVVNFDVRNLLGSKSKRKELGKGGPK